MLIPLSTDRPQRRFPLITWLLVALNIAVYLPMAGIERADPEAHQRLVQRLWLDPAGLGLHGSLGKVERLRTPDEVQRLEIRSYPDSNVHFRHAELGLAQPRGPVLEKIETRRGDELFGANVAPPGNWGWWALLSYQFVHGGFMHILGNLLVLWVFGPSVEDRFGRVGFLAFYLLGGVWAGLTHSFFETNPVVGASGAIAAVTGAFLVLFPRTHVKLFVFFFYIGVFEIPAVWFILLAIAKDVVGQGLGGGGVAFLAHLGGYSMGFAVSMFLLATRVLPHEDWSLLAVFRQAKRRAEFRTSARAADATWKDRLTGNRDAHTPARAEGRVLWQRASLPGESTNSVDPRVVESIARLRGEVLARLATGDTRGAIEAFRRFRRSAREVGTPATLPPRQQVDLGNALMEAGQHADAAEAYEAFVLFPASKSDPQLPRVLLMIALLYAKYLNEPAKASASLAAINSAFSEPELHQLADALRAQLGPVTAPAGAAAQSPRSA